MKSIREIPFSALDECLRALINDGVIVSVVMDRTGVACWRGGYGRTRKTQGATNEERV